MSAEAPPPPPPGFYWDAVNGAAYMSGGSATYIFKDAELAKKAFRVRPDEHSAGRAIREPYNDNHMLAFCGDKVMRGQCCTQAVLAGANHLEFEEWYANLAAKNRFLALLADQTGFTGFLVRVGNGDPVRNSRFWEHEKADAVEAFFGAVAADCGNRMDKFDALMREFGVFYPRDAADESWLRAKMVEADRAGLVEERERRRFGLHYKK